MPHTSDRKQASDPTRRARKKRDTTDPAAPQGDQDAGANPAQQRSVRQDDQFGGGSHAQWENDQARRRTSREEYGAMPDEATGRDIEREREGYGGVEREDAMGAEDYRGVEREEAFGEFDDRGTRQELGEEFAPRDEQGRGEYDR